MVGPLESTITCVYYVLYMYSGKIKSIIFADLTLTAKFTLAGLWPFFRNRKMLSYSPIYENWHDTVCLCVCVYWESVHDIVGTSEDVHVVDSQVVGYSVGSTLIWTPILHRHTMNCVELCDGIDY